MPTANGEIAFGKFSQLRQERRAGRTPEQQQPNAERFVEPEHRRQGESAKRHQDEVGQQSEHDQPGIAQRLEDLRDNETRTHRQHARNDKAQHGDVEALLNKSISMDVSRIGI